MIAEQNIIGMLMIDGEKIADVSPLLSADMFTNAMLGRIFLEYQRGYDNHKEVNVSTIMQVLISENYTQAEIGEILKSCVNETSVGTTIKSHAEVIVREHKARQLSRYINQIAVNPAEINGQIGKIIADLEALQDCKMANAKTIATIAKENKDRYFTSSTAEKMYLGIDALDNIIGGLEGGDVIVIGARPAVGKSALVTQITYNLADHGKKVCFYNLEMQEKQMYERFIVAKSGISLTRLRNAKAYLGDEKERFEKANDALMKNENIVISTGSKSVNEIRAEVRHMDYDIIIIDYLQLLKTDKEYRGNRTAEVGAISKAIKALAMELNIPIIALSQLNRASETRDTKEPTMADLREAGDIEQDASVILLMWNLDIEDKTKKGCKVEKNRQGENGKTALKFTGEHMRFEQLTEYDFVSIDKFTDDCPFK